MTANLIDLLSVEELNTAATRLKQPNVFGIKTVVIVETQKKAFDKWGMPTHLQERHITARSFNRYGYDIAELKRKYSHISQWIDFKPYRTGGYGKFSAQIKKFRAIAELPEEHAETCAIEGGSWGGFQVLGANWKDLGYKSAQDFLESMKTPQGQLEAFCRYIEKNNLQEALRQCDWHAFARGYNGKNYKKNKYAYKLTHTYKEVVSEKAPKKPIVKSKTVAGTTGVGAIALAETLVSPNQTPTTSNTGTKLETDLIASLLNQIELLTYIQALESVAILFLVALVIYSYLKDRGGYR